MANICNLRCRAAGSPPGSASVDDRAVGFALLLDEDGAACVVWPTRGRTPRSLSPASAGLARGPALPAVAAPPAALAPLASTTIPVAAPGALAATAASRRRSAAANLSSASALIAASIRARHSAECPTAGPPAAALSQPRQSGVKPYFSNSTSRRTYTSRGEASVLGNSGGNEPGGGPIVSVGTARGVREGSA